jgi:hypothetical protein
LQALLQRERENEGRAGKWGGQVGLDKGTAMFYTTKWTSSIAAWRQAAADALFFAM